MTIKTKKSSSRTKTFARDAKFQTPDEYLAAVNETKRAALERLRQTMREAIPQAQKCISYGLPSLRLNGKTIVSYGAAATHCAFYAGATVQKFRHSKITRQAKAQSALLPSGR